jgi:transposase-like protein
VDSVDKYYTIEKGEKRGRLDMARQSQTHVRQKAFLEAFAQSGNVVVASRVTGIPRSLVYQWIDKHQDFKAAFDKADKESAEHIEAEVYRRGVEGYLEPVFQKGSRVYEFAYDEDGKVLVDAKTNQPIMVPAYVRRYSDALLQLYLKGKLPEKYA